MIRDPVKVESQTRPDHLQNDRFTAQTQLNLRLEGRLQIQLQIQITTPIDESKYPKQYLLSNIFRQKHIL